MSKQNRSLGQTGPQVFPLSLGCMGMSGMYGASDRAESIATIHEAIDRGVTLFDTGDFYGMGHNEMLLAEALQGRRDQVLLSVKFGALRGPDDSWLGMDMRPAAIKNFLAYTLQRLRVDYIDIYRPARMFAGADVPVEETIGAIADLIKAGYIRHLGLSEVGPETIRRAHAVHPVVDLQIEYALVSRGPETAIFPVLDELGIGVTAYGVLSRGLLSSSVPAATGDYRRYLPRFTGGNLERNQLLVNELQRFAESRRATPAQIAIAWVMAKGERIVPVLGARTRTQLAESLAATQIELSAAEMGQLEALVPAEAIAGTRYDEHQMRMLDSERS